jgi:hypothetical protein
MEIQITETVTNMTGHQVQRVRTTLILRAAYLLIFISVILIWAGLKFGTSMFLSMGLFVLLTVTPCFLLYPLIRFCIGGKDSLLGIALTVAVEVGLKNKINKAIEKHERR